MLVRPCGRSTTREELSMDMSKMLKQAKKMQQQLADVQDGL